jgi:hypothetical protein
MRLTLLANGNLRIQDQMGATTEIGPEHPDYINLCMQYRKTARPNYSRARWFGILAIAIGLAGWWYNWHLLLTGHQFYPKLTLLGPLGLFGGMLMIFRPEWTGPLKSDSTKAHKTALIVVIALMAVFAGLDFYLLSNYKA